MKKIFNLLIVLGVVLSLGACEFFDNLDKMPDPEVKYASTFPVSGEWYVRYDHSTYGEDPFGAGFVKVYITNTAADDGKQVWLSDYPGDPDDYTFWQYKVKIPVDVKNLSFGSQDTVINVADGYPIQVLIRNGKIIKDASKQPSGVMTDSIYFEVWFEDLAGSTGIQSDTLFVGGFRRTGFLEDEH